MQMKLRNVRGAFLNVFEARAFQAGQDPTFSGVFLMPRDGEQHREVQAAIKATIEEKWGKEKPRGLKLALHPGEEKDGYDGFDESVVYVSARSKTRPTVVDRRRNPITREDGLLYSGCYLTAIVRFWAQDNQYGKRINCELTGIQFVKDGEPFSAGGKAADPDDFDELPDEDGDEPTVPRASDDGDDDLLG